jgi:hypothetical protein
MYWLSNYRHKIETSKKSCPVAERPLSDDRERREQREQGEQAAFQQTLEGRTSARLPMVVADLGMFLLAGVGGAGVSVGCRRKLSRHWGMTGHHALGSSTFALAL